MIYRQDNRRYILEEALLLYGVYNYRGEDVEIVLHRIEEALLGGMTMLQWRVKDREPMEMLSVLKKVHRLCQTYGVPLIINDYVELAAAVGAEGVHIGQGDGSIREARRKLGARVWIGVSAHTIVEALEAERMGADYLGVGAVFTTDSKRDANVLGLEKIEEIIKKTRLPVVGIGGITADTAPSVMALGATGVAVIRAIFGASCVQESTNQILQVVRKHRRYLPKKADRLLPAALTIAGMDGTGGAGMQADLKTFLAHGVYGMSALTIMIAQNTMGVYWMEEVTTPCMKQQLEAIFEDIFPDATKIGLVGSKRMMQTIRESLLQYRAPHVVIDPVMVATSGGTLLEDTLVRDMTTELFPLAELITPNIQEAEKLAGERIRSKADMGRVAKTLAAQYDTSVLLKGGHSFADSDDVLARPNGHVLWFLGERVNTPNTHGTGCTLSSAITAQLAKGKELEEAISIAKEYITQLLKAELDMGYGSGPLPHGYKHYIEG